MICNEKPFERITRSKGIAKFITKKNKKTTLNTSKKSIEFLIRIFLFEEDIK
jgi:hypothetical protein